MKKSWHSIEQIIRILREADGGMGVEELFHKQGISAQSYYRWRSKHMGMELKEAQRLRDLEKECRELKMMLAAQMLRTKALEIAPGKNI